MPIYEFHCNNCNTTFEEWLKMSDEKQPQACPDCGTMSQRQVSQTSFVLKGSGWYVTEYGKNSASSSSKDKTQKNASSQSETTDSSHKKNNEPEAKQAKPIEKSPKEQTAQVSNTQKQSQADKAAV